MRKDIKELFFEPEEWNYNEVPKFEDFVGGLTEKGDIIYQKMIIFSNEDIAGMCCHPKTKETFITEAVEIMTTDSEIHNFAVVSKEKLKEFSKSNKECKKLLKKIKNLFKE